MDEQNKQNEFEDTTDEYELEIDPNEVAESHDEDVDSALERETQDGKGGAVVPKATFKSYATDEVEKQEQ